MTEPPAGYPPPPPSPGPPPSYREHVPAPPAFPPHQATRADLQPYVAPMPYPMAGRLVSPGGRLGAALMDLVLALVTLYVGWLVWSLITWSEGQTPGKKLLGHVTVDASTGRPLDWGQMALRELCVKGLLGWLLGMLTCGVYGLVDAFMVFGDRQRTLHDKMANSLVRHL